MRGVARRRRGKHAAIRCNHIGEAEEIGIVGLVALENILDPGRGNAPRHMPFDRRREIGDATDDWHCAPRATAKQIKAQLQRKHRRRPAVDASFAGCSKL